MVHFHFLSAMLGLSFTYRVLAVNPVVHLSYSSFEGVVSNTGVTSWKGIPFAAPPVGPLRFARPVDPVHKSGIQPANKQGPLCIPTGSTTIPSGTSEDCLYLAVYAPTSANATSHLPVFVFIQGGGFNADSNGDYDGGGLINASGNDIVVVTFNYRVGPWGFLASNASDGVLPNNGLWDQRKVFDWVQKYISAFGGDPEHVTIGGDSAGAASVSLHLTAFGGKEAAPKFHAAAAESVSFATVLNPAESQYQYTHFAKGAGCDGAPTAQSLQCLRSKTAAQLQAANVNIPYPSPVPQLKAPLYEFNPVLDGGVVNDLTYLSFARGEFLRVPVIFGDDTNGGTVFTPRNTSGQNESDAFLTQQFPYLTTSQLASINELYPNANQSACPAPGCWWRQVSNAYGEMRYMCPTLYIASAYANASSGSSQVVGGGSTRRHHSGSWSPWSGGAKSWSYRYNVEDPTQVAGGLGVPHTVELNAIFGPENVVPTSSAPKSYFPGGINAEVVPVIQAYWTSFIKHYDPNVNKYPGSAEWTQYLASGEPQRLLFETGGATTMEAVDQGQRQRCAYMQSIGPSVKQKR